jgi:hypothetical protein
MPTEMATIRGELTMFREALTESRFDRVEKTLADIPARLPG